MAGIQPRRGPGEGALRLAFMGTPDFAVPSLAALAAAGHEIAAVYCQPPRPRGRGHRTQPSPVQACAEEHGWPVRTPRSLKDAEEQARFAALDLDVAVVVAYGLLLPPPILAAPRLGCLNVHASLLPRWRGAAPVPHAILAGDRESGVTIMVLDEGLDTGPILTQEAVAITPETTAAELAAELAERGAALLMTTLAGYAAGHIAPRPQPEEGATYAAKLSRAEAALDWRRAAVELALRVRALSPWPGASFVSGNGKGEQIKVLAAEALPDETSGSAPPGTLLDDRLTIACGEGVLRLTRVQRPGRKPMSAEELLRGFSLPAGHRLPLPEPAP